MVLLLNCFDFVGDSIYGPVQDVRIPYQQKRMFGFVTFVYPETVKLILAKGNPHFVCDARVLVKPYKEKGKVPDKYRHSLTHSHFYLITLLEVQISMYCMCLCSNASRLLFAGSNSSNRWRGESTHLVALLLELMLETHLISSLVNKLVSCNAYRCA